MNDKLDLKKHIRNVDDFPIPGIKFRDITSLIETPEPFRKTCKELTKITQDFSADMVVSIESRIYFCWICFNRSSSPVCLGSKAWQTTK